MNKTKNLSAPKGQMETHAGFYLGEEGEWVPEGWKSFAISELLHFENYRRIPLSAAQRKDWKGPYPYYGASGIFDYLDDFIFSGEHLLISEDGENLVSRKQPIAFKVDGEFWVNNHAHILSSSTSHRIYLLEKYISQLDIGPFVTGAAQPKLSKGSLERIPFILPENESEQKAIAALLGSLDDKIELLREQNETLEALAQTLFKRWFIDFNFPDENGNPYKDSGVKMKPSEFGEIPESWEVGSISLFADHIKNSVSPDKSPETLYRHYSIPSFDVGMEPVQERGLEIKSNKYEVVAFSILVSKLNPSTPRIWQIQEVEENSVCSTEFQVVKPQSGYFGFVYGALMSSPVRRELTGRAHGTSSSHQRVSPADIFDVPFPVSSDRKLEEAFSQTTQGLLTKAVENRFQIQTLTQLRDTLLPKLMKGEIRVPVIT